MARGASTIPRRPSGAPRVRNMCKSSTPPLLAVEVVRTGEACPFTNEKIAFELRQGEVVWLRGASGAGKSFTCLHLAGLAELPDATVR